MPTEGESAPSAEFADYLGVLKRRWPVVLLSMAVGTAIAGLLLVVLPKSYLATTSVYINPLPGQGDTPVAGAHETDGVNLDTEAQLLTSAVVTGRAREILGTTDSDTTLRDRVSVSVPPNSAILDVAYRAGTARDAAAGADAFARAYLANRQETAASDQAGQIASIQQQLDEAATHLSDLSHQLEALPATSAQRDVLLAQQNVLSILVTNLDDRLVTLQAGSPFPGQVISPAKPPSTADTPKALLYLPAGALVGLLLGLVAALARDRRPRRLRRGRDVERLVGLEVIGDLGAPHGAGPPDPLATSHRLATQLLARLGRGPWTLLVTAAAPGSSPSRVAENIAVALSRAGGRVAFVPGDPAAAPAGVDGGGDGLRRIAVQPGVPLSEQLQVARGRGVLDQLRADADFVVVASAPVLTSPDALALAPLCDGTLLAVRVGSSRTADVREALHGLRGVHAQVLGAVLLAEASRRPTSGRGRGRSSAGSDRTERPERDAARPGREVQAPSAAP